MSGEPVGTWALVITGLAILVAWDLLDGLQSGRLRLVNTSRQENPTMFWTYAALEGSLIFLVITLWIQGMS